MADGGHSYQDSFKFCEKAKSMHGPVYANESSHQFNIIPDKPPNLKDVNYPIYLTEDARHHYSEFIKKVEGRTLNF